MRKDGRTLSNDMQIVNTILKSRFCYQHAYRSVERFRERVKTIRVNNKNIINIAFEYQISS